MAPKKLATYQAKRDFKKTSEPSGKAPIRRAKYPRFVIQKHAATRLHYDLRLELDGVFKSWAVTKGPSLDPARQAAGGRGGGPSARLRRLRRHHPQGRVWRRHGDAVGPRLLGAGGGDRGRRSALRKGELKFILAGEKLQGSWVLVRMKRREGERGSRNNWLLIKHRDEFAGTDAEELLAQDRSVASGRSMDQIAAGKGRGAKPFMAAGAKAAHPSAIWRTNRDGRRLR